MKENLFFYEKPFFLGLQGGMLHFCSFYKTQVIEIFVKMARISQKKKIQKR